MKYLLDTANLDAIRYYTDIFPIAGVTSNPSIVKKEGKIDFFAHMNEIRSIIGMDKTLHIQVTALDTDGMLRDAETILNKVDDQVCVKVPVTLEGIKAIKTLKKQDVNVTATANSRDSLPWKQELIISHHTLTGWKIWESIRMMSLLLLQK